MARSLTCLILILLCSSLLLHPAFARKNKKSKPKAAQGPLVFATSSTATSQKDHRVTSQKNGKITTVTMPSTMSASVSIRTATPAAAAAQPSPPAPAPAPATTVARNNATAVKTLHASESLAMIVESQTEKSFTKHVCDMAANPTQCERILEGEDKKYMSQLPPGTIPKLSLEITAAVTVRAVHYMNEKLATNHVEPAETPRIEGCLDLYQEAMVFYNGAYVNFTMDPLTASKSLNEADVKIGLCESKLGPAGSNSAVERIAETNKLLRDLNKLISQEMFGKKKN